MLSWLAKNNSNDAHLQRVVAAASIVHSKAGMTEEELSKLSRQHVKSLDRTKPVFEGTEELSRTQRVRELQTVPVIIMADLSKSRESARISSLYLALKLIKNVSTAPVIRVVSLSGWLSL